MTKNIVIFDFDGTLTPHSLPKFEVLKKCGYENGLSDVKFMSKVATRVPLCRDIYYALYETFLRVIASSNLPLTDETITMGVENIEFNEGVHEFLKRLKDNGVENYILSSGIKSYLEKSSIGSLVAGVFATTFAYNLKGDISGVRFCMTDRRKVNAIRTILKRHELSEHDTERVIYIGDGLTDIPAMSYVRKNGGTTIFVVDEFNLKDVEAMKEKEAVDMFVKKDFNPSSELSNIIASLCNIGEKRNDF